jgi:triacylglycerol lipase
MKKIMTAAFALFVFAVTAAPLYAAGSAAKCNTKYPVILVHGAFFKDANMLGVNYWWGIPDALEDEGAVVFRTQQDSYNGTVECSAQVAAELGRLFALHPDWKKVNLIGHSQGPLECRYLISNLSIPGKGPARSFVASLTSISGVHRGSQIADLIYSLYIGAPALGKEFGDIITGAVDAFMSFFMYNEEDQNTIKLIYCLTTNYMTTVFNPMTPDVPGVYYQSYAGKIKNVSLSPDKLIFAPLWTAMKQMGAGDNDGMVSVESAKWGKFRGTLTGSSACAGVSHVNEVGHLFGVTPGFDAPAFYVTVVKELKSMGY